MLYLNGFRGNATKRGNTSDENIKNIKIGKIRMTELEKAWLAGFFDGDGNIHIYRRKRKNKEGYSVTCHLKIVIGQKDKKILEYIHKLVGYGIFYQLGSGFWHLEFSFKRAERFLREILPYLKVKRLEAQLGIQFQENNKNFRGSRNIPENEIKWRDMHYWLLRYIKKKRYNR